MLQVAFRSLLFHHYYYLENEINFEFTLFSSSCAKPPKQK